MTIVTGTLLTFSAIGNREDLSDMIYDISSTDTPFTAGIGKNKAKGVYHEWQTDELAAAAANAQIEGNETTFAAITPTVRVGNRCQILDKECIVSGTQEAVDKAGRKSEMVREMLKRTKELKRDREFVMLNNQAPVTGDSTTARQLRPVNSWITTNTSRNATGTPGANGSSSTAATDSSVKRALTEDLVKDVLRDAWTAGGEPDTIMVGPLNKQKVSGWTAGTTKFDKSEDKKLTAAIDVYASDFGDLKIVPNRFQRERDLWVLDLDLWKLSELRPMFTKDLAPTGDHVKGLIITECTLEACNEAGSGVVADLVDS